GGIRQTAVNENQRPPPASTVIRLLVVPLGVRTLSTSTITSQPHLALRRQATRAMAGCARIVSGSSVNGKLSGQHLSTSCLRVIQEQLVFEHVYDTGANRFKEPEH